MIFKSQRRQKQFTIPIVQTNVRIAGKILAMVVGDLWGIELYALQGECFQSNQQPSFLHVPYSS